MKLYRRIVKLQRRIRNWDCSPDCGPCQSFGKSVLYDVPVYQLNVALRSSPFQNYRCVPFSCYPSSIYMQASLFLCSSPHHTLKTIQRPPASLHSPKLDHHPYNNNIYYIGLSSIPFTMQTKLFVLAALFSATSMVAAQSSSSSSGSTSSPPTASQVGFYSSILLCFN